MIRRKVWRGGFIAACATLVVALLVATAAGFAAPIAAADTPEVPDDSPPTPAEVTVEDLDREQELRDRLVAIQAELDANGADRRRLLADIDAAEQRRLEINALLETNADETANTIEQAEAPTAVRRELAILVYMRGEPQTNDLIEVLRTGTFGVDDAEATIFAADVTRDVVRRLRLLEQTEQELRIARAALTTEHSETIEAASAGRAGLSDVNEAAELLEAERVETTSVIAGIEALQARLAAEEAARIEAAEAAARAGEAAQAAQLATASGDESPSAGAPDTTTDPGAISDDDAESPTTLPAGSPTHPLTGVRTLEPIRRPALAVKIDNSPRARPQSGINQADIVFEEVVEGGLTRFVAVFHSSSADPIGPVRSARTSDLHILANLNAPLFANSGANQATLAAVAASSLADVSINAASSAYRRQAGRPAPHNLYASTGSLWRAAPGSAGLPPEYFSHRDPGEPVGASARPARGVSIDFGSETVRYEWNGNGWARTIGGAASNDAAGVRVAPENVVVLFIRYGTSPADARSPEAIVAGSGTAWVFSDGHLIAGSWSRPTDESPTELLDESGNTIELSPGRTWVALAPIGGGTVRR